MPGRHEAARPAVSSPRVPGYRHRRFGVGRPALAKLLAVSTEDRLVFRLPPRRGVPDEGPVDERAARAGGTRQARRAILIVPMTFQRPVAHCAGAVFFRRSFAPAGGRPREFPRGSPLPGREEGDHGKIPGKGYRRCLRSRRSSGPARLRLYRIPRSCQMAQAQPRLRRALGKGRHVTTVAGGKNNLVQACRPRGTRCEGPGPTAGRPDPPRLRKRATGGRGKAAAVTSLRDGVRGRPLPSAPQRGELPPIDQTAVIR